MGNRRQGLWSRGPADTAVSLISHISKLGAEKINSENQIKWFMGATEQNCMGLVSKVNFALKESTFSLEALWEDLGLPLPEVLLCCRRCCPPMEGAQPALPPGTFPSHQACLLNEIRIGAGKINHLKWYALSNQKLERKQGGGTTSLDGWNSKP